jgi:predicted nuclease of predicted toxin-antitoxin system
MSFVRGAPPKVIWIRLGNCTTDALEQVLRDGLTIIAEFERDQAAAFLLLG